MDIRERLRAGEDGELHLFELHEEAADVIDELVAALEEVLPLVGWEEMDDNELREEHRLGNGAAEPILRARIALAKAKGKS